MIELLKPAFEDLLTEVIYKIVPQSETEFIRILKDEIFTYDNLTKANNAEEINYNLDNENIKMFDRINKTFPQFFSDGRYNYWVTEIEGLIKSKLLQSHPAIPELVEDLVVELAILNPLVFDNSTTKNSLEFIRRLKNKNAQQKQRNDYENAHLEWNKEKLDVLTSLSTELFSKKITFSKNAFKYVFREQRKIEWSKNKFRLLAYLLYVLKKQGYIVAVGVNNNKGYQKAAVKFFGDFSGKVPSSKYFTKTISSDKNEKPKTYVSSMNYAELLINSAILSLKENTK